MTEVQVVVADVRTDLVEVLAGAAPLPLVHCASVYVYEGTVPVHNGAGVGAAVGAAVGAVVGAAVGAAVGAGVGAEVGDDVGEAVP